MARPRSATEEPTTSAPATNDSQPQHTDSQPPEEQFTITQAAIEEIRRAAYEEGYAAGLAAVAPRPPLWEEAKKLVASLTHLPELEVRDAVERLAADRGGTLSIADRDLLLAEHRRIRARETAQADAIGSLTRPRGKQPPMHPSETSYEHVR